MTSMPDFCPVPLSALKRNDVSTAITVTGRTAIRTLKDRSSALGIFRLTFHWTDTSMYGSPSYKMVFNPLSIRLCKPSNSHLGSVIMLL